MAPNNTRCSTARSCAVLAAIAWGPTLSFGQDYGSYLGQTSGNVITCAEGQAAVSICVGHYFPLQLGAVPERCTIGFTEHDHTLRCVTRPNNDFYWYDVDAKTTKIKANAGEWAFCPPDHVAVSHCGSYTPSALCGGAQQELTCAPISLSYVRLDSTDVIAGCVSSKFNNDCPQGYALTGTCVSHGLFSNNDCNTELCSGKSNIGTGIRCTRIEGYEYAGVGDYTVAESPRFSFDGVCKAQTYSLEGQSDRTITESQTFSTRSSIQTTATSSSSSSQSLTNSLSVTTTVGAEVGFPKLGLGASASTTAESGFEYNTEFERSSSFSEELFSEEEVSTTVTVEYTLQGGLTWTGMLYGSGRL